MSMTRTARQTIKADVATVLDVLTDTRASARWAPIEFETDLASGKRLTAGTPAVVEGRLAGQRAQFTVELERADCEQVSLTATGPCTISAEYRPSSTRHGTMIEAAVGVNGGRGISGKLLTRAAEAILSGGAVAFALRRIAIEAERAPAASPRWAAELRLAASTPPHDKPKNNNRTEQSNDSTSSCMVRGNRQERPRPAEVLRRAVRLEHPGRGR